MTSAAGAAVVVVVLGLALHPWVSSGRRTPHAPRRSRRGHAPPPDAWAQWLETVAANVRGGVGLSAAIDAAHHHHHLTGSNIAPGAGLRVLVDAHPDDPHEAVVTQVLTIAAALGGSVAATVQAGATVLRERAAIAAEAGAHAAQARLSARVLTAVPLVFAAWNLVTGDHYRRAVVSPVGAAAAGVGVALSVVGWRWMHRLVDRAAR